MHSKNTAQLPSPMFFDVNSHLPTYNKRYELTNVPVCLPGSHSCSGGSASAVAPNRQGHLRSAAQQQQHAQHQQQQLPLSHSAQAQHHLGHRRALPPAPVLPLQSLRSVAPPIYYNSSGNSSTTSSGGSYLQSNTTSATTESFVDQLKRSASSVNPKNRSVPIAKPIRRSKSQRAQNFVTSIQHGGSVTLVSLNGELDQEKPNSEIKHVHHHHFVQDWDSGIHPGGSQTLPNRKSGQLLCIHIMNLMFLYFFFLSPSPPKKTSGQSPQVQFFVYPTKLILNL